MLYINFVAMIIYFKVCPYLRIFFVTRGLLSEILFDAFMTYACTVPTRSNTTGPIVESFWDCIRKKTVINVIKKPLFAICRA